MNDQTRECSTNSGATSDRRSFLKGAAAGIATVTVAATTANAQRKPPSGDGDGSPALVNVAFRQKVEIKDVHLVLERILTLAGCPTCGLSGIDIRMGMDRFRQLNLRGVDVPVDVGVVGQLPGQR